jgi:hypothetical protein
VLAVPAVVKPLGEQRPKPLQRSPLPLLRRGIPRFVYRYCGVSEKNRRIAASMKETGALASNTLASVSATVV